MTLRSVMCQECGDADHFCSCSWRAERAAAEAARDRQYRRDDIIDRGREHPLRRSWVKFVTVLERSPIRF